MANEILDREEPKKELNDRYLWILGVVIFSFAVVFKVTHYPWRDILGIAGGVILSGTATASYLVVKKKTTLRSLSVLVPVVMLLILKYFFQFYNIWLIATAVSSFILHFILLARFRGRI
jgi:hypothetical protein